MAIKIFENHNIKNNNSFGFDLKCKKFIEYSEKEDIINFIKENKNIFKEKFLILGNGTNLLFKDDFYDGIIIHQKEKKISHISELEYETRENDYFFRVDASVNLDTLIEASSSLSYGLLNLSGIPGTVGAGVVQNCGAFGSEISEYFTLLTAINVKSGEEIILKREDCNFNYRTSVFKNKYANSYIILDVFFAIPKLEAYSANFNNRDFFCNFIAGNDYINIIEEINKENDEKKLLSLKIKLQKMARKFILETRNKKIPDYKIIGNAGSFFKNPIVSKEKLDKILLEYPDTKYFKNYENDYKLAAGWLIDKAGLKGYKHKNAAISDINALILTNPGNSCGKELVELSEIVIEKVYHKFNVQLEPEVIFL